ncbi:MAG TPA: aminopeptidase, partial [Myxococcaceae bacterium]|nr:aminopeptidase [Myxococcaceae bacterium]
MRAALTLALWATQAWAGEPSPEVQLCVQHFRAGERARAEKVLGSLDALPFYRIQLEVDPQARGARGIVQITYTAERPLSRLFLRLTPNAIGGGHVELSQVKLAGRSVILDEPQPGLYRAKLDPPLAAGASISLEAHLEALVPAGKAQPSGFDALIAAPAAGSDHGAFSATPSFVSLVGIVPMVPRLDARGDPSPGPAGFGDLALYPPANVMAAVTVPRGWRAIATGEALGEVPEPDGRVRFSFAAAAVRDFPVFAATGYADATASVGDLEVVSSFEKEDRAQGEQVLRHAAAIVSDYQKRLGPLPYKRLRVVEAPLVDGAGGMEFPGLITLSDALYHGAADPQTALMGVGLGPLLGFLSGGGSSGAPVQLKALMSNMLEFTTAHELAHQYFAGLVGSDPIREPVVDEPLAQYLALLYVEWRYGKPAAQIVRDQQWVMPYQMHRVMGGPDGAADRSTDQFGTATEYAALIYSKAPGLHGAQR